MPDPKDNPWDDFELLPGKPKVPLRGVQHHRSWTSVAGAWFVDDSTHTIYLRVYDPDQNPDAMWFKLKPKVQP